ncbi:unnamed protein product [Alopecurus aequalis]
MKMSRCLSTSTLLMLSLEAALLAAAIDMGTIRLPSDTQAAAARPWKCCDRAVCTKSIPPICQCFDEVEQCAPTCKSCEVAEMFDFLFVCKDQYIGDPGPICRPWECCDAAFCTKSMPPICHCTDEVEQCAATCKDCAASTSNPYRLVCQDSYRAYTDRNPGPVCTPR